MKRNRKTLWNSMRNKTAAASDSMKVFKLMMFWFAWIALNSRTETSLKSSFQHETFEFRCNLRRIDLSVCARMWLNMTLNSLFLTKLGRIWREAIKLIANYLVSSRFRSHRKIFANTTSVDASVSQKKGKETKVLCIREIEFQILSRIG